MSETLLHEIRAARPEAPAALRDRVRELSVRAPVREPLLDRLRFTWGRRRLALVVAPAAVAVALVAGSVIGLTRGDAGSRDAAGDSGAVALTTVESFQSAEAAPLGPVPGQLQRFEAELGLR